MYNKLSKVAIAVICLMGNINHSFHLDNSNTAMGSERDESLYSQLANWSVGLSVANAGIERINVRGTRPPSRGWGWGGGGGRRGGGDDETDRGDDGGRPDPRPDPRQKCKDNASRDESRCIALAQGTATMTATLCLGFVNPLFVGVCAGVSASGGFIGVSECQVTAINARADCSV